MAQRRGSLLITQPLGQADLICAVYAVLGLGNRRTRQGTYFGRQLVGLWQELVLRDHPAD